MSKFFITLFVVALGVMTNTQLLGQVVFSGGVIISSGGNNCGTCGYPQPPSCPPVTPQPVHYGPCGQLGYAYNELVYSETVYGQTYYSTYVDMSVCNIRPLYGSFLPNWNQGQITGRTFGFTYPGNNKFYFVSITEAQYASFMTGSGFYIRFLK